MNKKFKTFVIIATILYFIGLAMYLITPYIPRWMGETEAAAFYGYLGDYYTMPFRAFALWFNFGNLHPLQIVGLAISCVLAALMIIWFIFIFAKKRYKALISWVYVLITWLISAYILLHISYCSVGGRDGLLYELLAVGDLATDGSMFPIIHLVVLITAFALGVLGTIASAMVYCSELGKTIKYKKPAKVVAMEDDEKLESIEAPIAEEIVPNDTVAAPAEEQIYSRVIKGPLLVQYINTTGVQPQVTQAPYAPYPYPYYPDYYGYDEQPCECEEEAYEEPAPVEEVKRNEDPNITAIRKIMNQNLKG